MGRRGPKVCGQDEGSQKGCRIWRVTNEFTRGRVLQPPVMASVEVLYDMKED